MKMCELRFKISKNNIKALLWLALQYKTITIETLNNTKRQKDNWKTSSKLRKLTGFNSNEKCSVCLSVKKDCDKCFWSYQKDYVSDGFMCTHQITYKNIDYSDDDVKLKKNMEKRADYILKQLVKAGCIWYNKGTNRWRISPAVLNNGVK